MAACVVFSSRRANARGEDTMALIEHTTMTPLGDVELEAGLRKLMPFLRAFAQSLSGNRELAEDLAQNALMKVWRSRRSFMPGSNLKAWVFAILRNEFFSHQRRAWRQAPWDAESAEAIPAALDEQRWAVELSDATCAMKALPDPQREALMLVGVGGFSYEETAARTSCTVGTTKSRVARARKSLTDILESRHPLPTDSRPANGAAISELLVQLNLVGKQAA
jgi:RNA polymerase sigma-70 factor (ECF subfamily)